MNSTLGFRPTTYGAGNTRGDPCVVTCVPVPCFFVIKYAIQNDRLMALMGKIDGTCNSPSGMVNAKHWKLYQFKALTITLN